MNYDKTDFYPENTSVVLGHSYAQYLAHFQDTQPEYAHPISYNGYVKLLHMYEQQRTKYYEHNQRIS